VTLLEQAAAYYWVVTVMAVATRRRSWLGTSTLPMMTTIGQRSAWRDMQIGGVGRGGAADQRYSVGMGTGMSAYQ
jgi:hypothetical protein